MVCELSSMDWVFSWLILTRCVSFHDAAILSNGKRMMEGVLNPTPSSSNTVRFTSSSLSYNVSWQPLAHCR